MVLRVLFNSPLDPTLDFAIARVTEGRGFESRPRY
jgi:hypothetical protein